MQCVILAGGPGTRMSSWTKYGPNTLIPIGGRPFASYQLELLASAGITEVVYAIGHRGDQVRAYVEDGARWGLRVRYADEGEQPRGTAGALRLAHERGLLAQSFFVVYGHSFTPVPFSEVWQAFHASGMPALMCVTRNQGRWGRGNADYQPDMPLIYDKSKKHGRAPEMRFSDCGISVLNRDAVLSRIPSGVADLAGVMRELSFEGHLAGFQILGRSYKIGSPAGLADFEYFVAEGGLAHVLHPEFAY